MRLSWLFTACLLVGCSGSATVGGAGASSGSGETPLCGEPCADPHGCYPCAEGSKRTVYDEFQYCVGGCWDTAPPPDTSCSFYGRSFPVGSQHLDSNDCSNCDCRQIGDGAGWTCEAKACIGCRELSGQSYISRDVNECAVIDYACPANIEGFGDDCGCGCRQNPDCAETYDCSNGCERDVIETWCPFSKIID